MKTLVLIPVSVAAVIGFYSSTAIAQTVTYISPIADYQPFVDEKVTAWKVANEEVGQIGGWRAYAREAQQPENTPKLAPTVAKPDPKPDAKAGSKP